MARYNGPVCRLCRREGMKLFLKGSRCYTKKCAFERRRTPPGQHGVRRRKMSDYGIAAAREAEDPACLQRPGAPVPALLRRRRDRAGRDRREPAAPAGDPPGQRRVPHGLRHQPCPGAPAGEPRPLRGQRPATDRALVPGPRRRPDRGPREQPQDGILQERQGRHCAARSDRTGSASTPTSSPGT